MAHTFDSGLAAPQRTLVREACVAALAELLKTSGSYLQAVIALPAPIRFGTDSEWWVKDLLGGQSPSVGIALGERTYTPAGTDAIDWRGPLTVHAYCCSNNARSLLARLASDVVARDDNSADPGLDTIVEHVRERLGGLPLTAARGGALQPIREDVAYIGGDWTIVELVLEVQLYADTNPRRSATTVAEELLATHEETEAGAPSELETLTTLDPP